MGGPTMTQAVGKTGKFAYRPEIDGLRALAVVAILIFHLHASALPGGYLGVDIFFVISGYLITGIIHSQIARGEFTIGGFYARRIRRIIPAMVVMVALTLAAGCVLLLPSDLIDLAKSSIATILFNANHYSLLGAGYFARSSDLKPLNHMWSLGVEEQFYLFFPLILIGLSRLPRRAALIVLSLLVFGSLGSFIVANRIGAGIYAFFLIPTRAWELGAGALLAFHAQDSLARPYRRVTAAVTNVAGAAMIGFALATGRTPLVGWLPPSIPATVGTVLLIRFLDPASFVGRVFAWRPIVFVGLISFSLYLWHWPLVVFTRYWLIREPGWNEVAILTVATLACSTLSWRFVEERFRAPQLPFRHVARYSVVACLGILVASVTLIAAGGLPQRFDPLAGGIAASVDTHYRCSVFDYLRLNGSRACRMNLPSGDPAVAKVVLLGNSHSQMYAPLVKKLLIERNLPGLLVPANLCIPSFGVNVPDCAATSRRDIANVAALPAARLVILATNWDYRVLDLRTPENQRAVPAQLFAGIDETIAMLRKHGKQVVLIGPVAQPNWDFASITGRSVAFGRTVERPSFESRAEFDRWAGPVIAHFSGRSDVDFIRPDLDQCGALRCEFVRDGISIFSDVNHIAGPALKFFEARLRAGLERPLSEVASAEPKSSTTVERSAH